MKPFLFYDIFELQSKLHAETKTIDGLGEIIIIDDFYKNPDRICELLKDSAIPPFKINSNSRNFKDYYDCRLTIPAYNDQYDQRDLLGQVVIGQIIKDKLDIACKMQRYDFSFNIFQWVLPPPQNYQFFPHADGKNIVGVIIYLNQDPDENGGTAFYRDVVGKDPKVIGYDERHDVKVDINAHCDMIEVVPGNFNRCVVFPGWFPHGAYIGQHDFYTGARWRMNQIYFFEIER